ncbi:hypothetical protein ACX0G9_05245 [Flavitalea flava]
MPSQHLFQLFLVLHLIGFTIMAGTVVADYSNNSAIIALKSRMTLFHTAQLLFFIIIFVLSVFRF